MKKLAVLVLCVLWAAPLFSGGQGQSSGGKGVKKGPANDAEAHMKLTSKAAEPVTLPIVNDKITVGFMSYPELYVVSKMNGYADMEVIQELEKRTRIAVRWREESYTNPVEKINLMFATGEPEDIIWDAYRAAGGAKKIMDDGLIVPLNWYIENYAPNLKKLLLENRQLLKEISLDDGRIFMFPEIRFDPSTRANSGFVLRKDWLDKLGLKPPATIDEWYAVLKAFKTRDPNGNGKADEVPFTGLGRQSSSWSWMPFGCAFGLADTGGLYLDQGKVQHPALHPNFRNYVSTMAKWYAEGLIDPEYVTNTTQMVDAKMTGDVGGSYYGALSGGLGKYLSAKYRPGQAAFDLVPVANPLAPDGKYYTNIGAYLSLVPHGASIGVNNKYIIETTKWMDYHYSQEGTRLLNYGIEGRSFTLQNGREVYTDLVMKNSGGLTLEEAAAKYAGGTIVQMPGFDLGNVNVQIKNAYPQQALASSLWEKSDTSMLLPSIYLPEAQTREAASVTAEVKTYMDEMVNKFVMGQEPLANYDRFVSTIKSLGMERILGYYNEAYQKWLKD
jgi:putative aldouronate transport system substrate-binding protein